MRRRAWLAALGAAAGLAGSGLAQDTRFDPATSIKFDLGGDAPVAVESFNPAESSVSSRGGALVIDLHVLATLRNTSKDYIRGVTLLLLAQESTPGGKMSVTQPVLNVAPGESFPVRIDGRLMRPLQPGFQPGTPMVRVSVDGVLFKNYEFYGPDRLNSRRQMVAWEMQAERDRKYFKEILRTQGPAGLQRAMLDSLDRQARGPSLDVQLAAGRTTSSAATAPGRVEQFAFLEIPDSPVRPQDGWAEIARNEARAPQIQVRNTSAKNIRYVEIAWLIKDTQGHEYLAGSVPASESELYLPPGRSAKLIQSTSLRFSRDGGRPVDIQSMTGFVSQVEFSDHTVWIPRREVLQQPSLQGVMPPSYEEQRLTNLYRTRNIDALVHELSKF